MSAIEAIPAFKKTAKQLGVDLRCSDEDAQELLIVQVLDHRLNSWTYHRIYSAAINRDIDLVCTFEYARRDIRRSYYTRENREVEKKNELRSTSLTESSPPDLSMLADVFHNEKTLAWVKCLLIYGQNETQERFHQTNRDFSRKLREAIKFCNKHPEKLEKIRDSYKTQQERLAQANIDYESGDTDVSSDDILDSIYANNKREYELNSDETEQQIIRDVQRKNKAIADKEKAQWQAFVKKHGSAFE